MARTRRFNGAETRRAFRPGIEQLEDRAVPSSVNVAVDKTILSADSSGNVFAGDQVTYQVVVSNSGPGTATGVNFTDNLPDSLTNISWTSNTSGTASGNTNGTLTSGTSDLTNTLTLASGASVTYTITATLPSTASSITNSATATVGSGDTDTNTANNTDSVTNTVLAPATDVGVTKTDNLDTVAPGQTVTYTVVVRNNGTAAVSGVAFADDLPATLTNVTWNSSSSTGASGSAGTGNGDISETLSLAAGSTVTYSIRGTVGAAVSVGSTIANTAMVNATGDQVTSDNSATDTNTVTNANISVTKTDNVTSVGAGQQVTYTIVVRNTGGADLTGVTLTDNFPVTLTGATWTSTVTSGTASGNTASGSGNISETLNLQSGAVVTYTVTATVASGVTAGSTISNTATVATLDNLTETSSTDNTATDTDTVKTLDVSVSKTDNLTTVAPGQSITYTITVSNAAGNADVTGATLTDTFPAGLNASSVTWTSTVTGASGNQASGTGTINDTGLNLPAGSSITYTVHALVSSTATNGTTIQNTAAVTATGDTNTSNNSASDTDTVAIPTGPVNLAITKTDNSKFAVNGKQTTYTITVTNLGSNTAAGAQVRDLLSSEFVSGSATWTSRYSNGTVGNSGTGDIIDTITLAAGQSITYTLKATVSASARGGLSNTATVTPATGVTDTNTANNTSTDRDTILPKSVPAFFNQFVVGAEGANGHVKVYGPGGSLRYSFLAFEGFGGAVRVATGDVNRDGVDDIIVGAGFGAPGGHVKVFDGATGALVASFLSFDTFLGGVDVAVGDVNGDGFGDLIVGSGLGAAHVKVFSLATGSPQLIASFLAHPGFTGGTTVAAGDVNGDGFADIITGTVLGPAHVEVFSLASGSPTVLASFITQSGYNGGIDVAAGNLRGDGRAEIAIAPLSAGGSVQVFSIDSTAPLSDFVPNFPGRDTGLRIAIADADADGDGDGDLIIAAGPGHGTKVRAYDGISLAQIEDFDAFAGYQGGIYIG